jgi:putative acetyltransferase
MNHSITIRKYQPSDARSLVDIFYNTIHKINIRDYTLEQINAWAPESFLDLDGWTKKWSKSAPYVAELNKQIVGFAEFDETGFIDCFYVHHEFQGKGIGSALMMAIHKEAEAKHVRKIFADVSITAKHFFECNGFIVVKEQLIEKRGATLKNYKMEKLLINH